MTLIAGHAGLFATACLMLGYLVISIENASFGHSVLEQVVDVIKGCRPKSPTGKDLWMRVSIYS